MPKTRGQKVIFGLLMSFFMVLAMELYNTGLRNGGLTNAGILEALRELPLMLVLCFFTSTLLGDPAAPPCTDPEEYFRKCSQPLQVSTRYSLPSIKTPEISLQNGTVKIVLCQTEYYANDRKTGPGTLRAPPDAV